MADGVTRSMIGISQPKALRKYLLRVLGTMSCVGPGMLGASKWMRGFCSDHIASSPGAMGHIEPNKSSAVQPRIVMFINHLVTGANSLVRLRSLSKSARGFRQWRVH
jgi:hypothetical protein